MKIAAVVVLIGAVIALYVFLCHHINQMVFIDVCCPVCGHPYGPENVCAKCEQCGGYVCTACMIGDGERLCQDCYLDSRIGDTRIGPEKGVSHA